jgi:GTPase SAR1 family protein
LSEEGRAFAQSIGAPFFETSAKCRINIDECFADGVRLARQSLSVPVAKSKKKQPIPALPSLPLPKSTRLYDSILQMVHNPLFSDVQLVSDDWDKFKVCPS